MSAVIINLDIWRAALLRKRYGSNAMLETAIRADELLDCGDFEGCCEMHRILDAIERLQAKAPAEEEKMH